MGEVNVLLPRRHPSALREAGTVLVSLSSERFCPCSEMDQAESGPIRKISISVKREARRFSANFPHPPSCESFYSFKAPPCLFFYCQVGSQLERRRWMFIAPLSKVHCKEIWIYVFPEKELRGLNPHFHIHVSVSDLYISMVGLPILLQQNRPILLQ